MQEIWPYNRSKGRAPFGGVLLCSGWATFLRYGHLDVSHWIFVNSYADAKVSKSILFIFGAKLLN
jgi:hypothetical protein